MIPLLILIVLLIALIGWTFRPKRRLPDASPRPRSFEPDASSLLSAELFKHKSNPQSDRRLALLEKAAQGDRTALTEARATEDGSYEAVLDALIARAQPCQEELDSLVSHILENDLRTNRRLAEIALKRFVATPAHNKRLVAQTLHVAALSNDAESFHNAVDQILKLWSNGSLPEMSGVELRGLFESEYWVLGSEARSSGAGFALKQRLGQARCQLATAAGKTVSQNASKECSHE